MESSSRIVIVVVVVAAAVFGFLLWRNRPARAPAPVASVAHPVVPAVVPTPVVPPAKPAIQHPIAAIPEAPKGDTLPGLDDADTYVRNLLIDLLGRKPVASFLNLDGFARRFVATVNNLGTDNAPSALWPVHRTEGQFVTQANAGSTLIAPENDGRYAAMVQFVESIDVPRAVSLYKRLYPLFQRAYEDLGESGKYFNDRVVGIIDELLATPEITAPIKVRRVTVQGIANTPGAAALYVFDDPVHETRPAGQKILLRMGRANAQRLKAKLAEVRSQIATAPPR